MSSKMWLVDEFPLTSERPFGNLSVYESLFWYDGPLIFVSRHGDACFFAVINDCDKELGIDRFLVSRVTEQILEELKANRLSVYSALDQPDLWIVDMSYRQPEIFVRRLPGLNAVPQEARPDIDGLLEY